MPAPILTIACGCASSPSAPGTAFSPATCSSARRPGRWPRSSRTSRLLQAPSVLADPEQDGTNGSTFILVDFSQRMVIIGGTEYAGEIKKSVFSILNYLLPERDVLPMHCSANIGERDDVSIFFGLSGTGKTTLSADPSRTLIGDDEHGWSSNGVFNFEGGCYAKVIRLSAEAEPEIFATTRHFGTVLENVVLDPVTRVPDLDDAALTENTRASYPVEFIPNTSDTGLAGHAENIVMLTADAFGVLPPVSMMTPEQAMYHFLSGYTARVAGTEKGVGSEPQATFSTCFGAPFMPRHPSVYAQMLGEKIETHGAKCWLVNTGWSGGAYGVGERMKIAHTRAMIRAILDGTLATVNVAPDPNFGVLVPQACPDVPADVLNPKSAWSDKRAPILRQHGPRRRPALRTQFHPLRALRRRSGEEGRNPRGGVASQPSNTATARVQPAEAPRIFTGKQHTVKPSPGSASRLCSFSRWQ